jgi:hypothetical protein
VRDEDDFDADLARVIVTGQDGKEIRYAAVDFERGIVHLPTGVTGTVTISFERARKAFLAFNEAAVQLGESLRRLVRSFVGEVVDRMRLRDSIEAHAYWNRFRKLKKKQIIIKRVDLPSRRHVRQERVNRVDRAAWKRRRFNQQFRKKNG